MRNALLAVLALACALPAAAAPATSDAAFAARLSAAEETLGAAAKVKLAANVTVKDEDALLALLESPDVNTRIEAARGLKLWAAYGGKCIDKLLERLQDRSENVLVRREAARALSADTLNQTVRDALLEVAQRQ